MPVTTSSRRSKRPVVSDIEDDQPSQPRADEVEEEGGTRSRRRPATDMKKEKKASASRQQQRSTEADEDDDGDDDGRIDVANFSDQPLGKADVTKLQGIARDWNHMEKQVRQNWRVVGDVAVSLAEAAEGDDAEKVCCNALQHNYYFIISQGLTELDIIMKDLLDIGVEMQSHEKTIDDISQKVAQGVEVVSKRICRSIPNT